MAPFPQISYFYSHSLESKILQRITFLIIHSNMQNTFPEMRSESYNPRYISILKWGIAVVLIICAITLLVLLIDDASEMVYFFLFLMVSMLAGVLVYDILRNKDHKVSCLLVDHRGMLFLNKEDKVLSEMKYQDLVKSRNPYTRDLFSEASAGKSDFRKNLWVYERRENSEIKKRKVNFEVIPLKNKYSLIGHFLKGVTLFRPDLNIDAEVYKDFYLDEKTFRFMPESLKRDILLKTFIIAVIILGLIFIFPIFE